MKEQKSKVKNLPQEIQVIKDEISSYGKQVKGLNDLIKQYNTEYTDLTSTKEKLKINIENLKKTTSSVQVDVDYNKKEMEEINVQLKELNESISKNDPIFSALENDFLQLKKQYVSLGGPEEDIPKMEDDMSINTSKIINSIKEIELLERWLGRKIFKACYKSSASGLSILNFHKGCDKVGPTITIIKTDDGDILGGYTKNTWGGRQDKKPDNSAFLFNLSKQTKFPVKNEKNAMTSDEDYFLIFGRDFLVNYMGICFSGFPMDYGGELSKPTDFSKTNKFLVVEMETYSLVLE